MSSESVRSDEPAGVGDEFIAEARRRFDSSLVMIRHCLGQLDDAQVWWRPREDMNSVGNLLLHLAGNLRQRLGAIVDGQPDVRDRLLEFTERGPIPKGELVRRFEEAAGGAGAVISALSPERLLETRRVPLLDGTTEKSVLGVVLHALTHLNGHAQEILQMTRSQLGDAYVFMNPSGVPPRAGSDRGKDRP
jgi:hypothetical protein